jgi:riboflavin synthase
VKTGFESLENGESIAMNGTCLTVFESGSGWFAVQAMGTTLGRTTIGSWKAGTRVNLERAMRADSNFGGHIVQGHVDCVGEVVATQRQGGATLVDIRAPEGFEAFMVLHGSIAVDGVSLTVNAFPKPDTFQVALIDFTLQHTNLSDLAVGSRVHLEGDVIGKYVQRAMEPYLKGAKKG